MSEIKKEKTKTVELKVILSHPAKKFQLGKHSIGIKFEKYELSEAELKELATDGPKKWLEIKKYSEVK
jgi:hypothetical protein